MVGWFQLLRGNDPLFDEKVPPAVRHTSISEHVMEQLGPSHQHSHEAPIRAVGPNSVFVLTQIVTARRLQFTGTVVLGLATEIAVLRVVPEPAPEHAFSAMMRASRSEVMNFGKVGGALSVARAGPPAPRRTLQ